RSFAAYYTCAGVSVKILVASRRPCDSDAFATWSYVTYVASPFSAATFVSAAVNVVLPWSTCPIVPTFTWGFVRSNFAFAMLSSVRDQKRPGESSRRTVTEYRDTPFRDALSGRLFVTPSRLALHFADNLFCLGFRHFLVFAELHALYRAALAPGS